MASSGHTSVRSLAWYARVSAEALHRVPRVRLVLAVLGQALALRLAAN